MNRIAPALAAILLCSVVAGCGDDNKESVAEWAKTVEAKYTTATTDTPTKAPGTTTRKAPTAQSDAAIERDREFYLAFDNELPALDRAVADWQNDGSATAIKRLVARLQGIYRRYRAAGGGRNPGAEDVLMLAKDAATNGDVAELARIRRDLTSARSQLTEQAFGQQR